MYIYIYIYSESIKTGVVQDISKDLTLLLFIKNGMMTEPRNYQPIAVLSLFSKVLERLVHDQLYSFLEIKEILHKYQFGFQTSHTGGH